MGFRVSADVFLKQLSGVADGDEQRDSGDEARDVEDRIVGSRLRNCCD
jgi:hypothetical protein